MDSYVKPKAQVSQEFNTAPTEITEPLRAHISGPNADLHRYSNADEKPTINVGAYDYQEDATHPWPGRAAGSLVDLDYVKVFFDNALMLYFEDLIGSDTTVTPVAGHINRVKSSAVSFKTNGAEYPHSPSLLDRGAKVGDTVYLRSVTGVDPDCVETELWTYITGFDGDETGSLLGDAYADANNRADTDFSASISKTAGADNCVTAAVDASGYDGLADGNVTEQYTITVIRSSVSGCSAARLRVTSASGNDDVAEVTPESFGEPTAIGTRGLFVTWSLAGTPECAAAAASAGVEANEFVPGQKWVVNVAQLFEAPLAAEGGEYAGAVDDVYVVEVTKGGTWADLPEITVTTAKGLDFSGPTVVTDTNTAVAIGSQGVTILFYGNDGSATDSTSATDDPVAALRKGDKYYIPVTAAKTGPLRQLILRHNLPAAMREATDLDLRLYIKDNIQISANRLGAAPLTNWTTEPTQLLLSAGIQAYHPEWTDNGTGVLLDVRAGTVYIEYREWLTALVGELGAIQDPADLGDIPGPNHPDNPLKYGVAKALGASNGTVVRYTAVANPDDLDSWTAVLELIKGKSNLYNLAPQTFNTEVLALYAAHINAESGVETSNWKAGFFPTKATEAAAIVSDATADDHDTVLATLSDNPNASGTQYTLLEVPDANAHFITNGVVPGDTVRFLYTTDGFGNEIYSTFVVDTVLSEDALLLLTGHTSAITEPQKIEIWHTYTKSQLAAQIAAQGAHWANRRICAVWPDYVGSGGETVPGYALCAALAGEVSGVVPHQGLTNVEVPGFDDFSRSDLFFNDTQLNTIAASGVWICTVDTAGVPHTRHGLTTDMSILAKREEMMRRNEDSMSYVFLNRLKPFIGRTNVTRTLLDRLRYELERTIKYFENNDFSDDLGGQLISGTIRTLQQHPLLADHVEIVIDLVQPAPNNVTTLHLVV